LSNQDSLDNGYVALVVAALYKTALNYQKLSVEDIAVSNTSIACYPNPAKDILYVNHNNLPITHLSLWDMTGKMLLQQKADKITSSSMLNLQSIPSGLYLLKAETMEQSHSMKIEIIK
jgi:hypothetical protein